MKQFAQTETTTISSHIQNFGNGINNTHLLYYIVVKAKKKNPIWFKITHQNLCTPTKKQRWIQKNLNIYLASCNVKSEHTTSSESPIHRHRYVFVVNWDEWDGHRYDPSVCWRRAAASWAAVQTGIVEDTVEPVECVWVCFIVTPYRKGAYFAALRSEWPRVRRGGVVSTQS